MGKIPNGILGGVSGKVAGVVGGNWKGVNYLRAYLIPADPQTPAQMLQRQRMQQVNNVSKNCLTTIIHPFWNPFAVGKSGIHLFTSVNLLRWTNIDEYQQCLLTQGQLEGVLTQGCDYDSDTGEIYASWYSTYEGNGLETDSIGLFWFDVSASYGGMGTAGLIRSDMYTYWNIGPERDPDNLRVWMFAYRGIAPSLEVSDSINDVVIPAS